MVDKEKIDKLLDESQPSDDEFERYSQSEELCEYQKDGYHPVRLGELYKDGQYAVIQKLGWGRFSTVWLVKDNTNNQYKALKIQKSKPSYGESALDELQILQDLQKNESNEKWLEFISQDLQGKHDKRETYTIRLLDNFIHFGVHGKHYCSVFDIMGPNLLDLIYHFDDREKLMKEKLVKQITKQILIGLVYMHEICNLIHTDLKPENIMIQLDQKQFNEYIEKLKQYKKKPVSMKFLELLQEGSCSKKNKKKYDKKKLKKKQNKLEEQKQQQQQQQDTQGNQGANEQQGEEEKKECNATENKNQAEISENQTKQQQNKQSSQELSKEETKSENQKPLEQIKPSRNKVEEDKDWEDCNKEEELYTLIWKNDIPLSLDESIQIKIVDMGNACWTHKHFTNNIQTREYRSPEAILGLEYSTSTDIWSVACIVFELLTNDYLFKPKKTESYKKNEHHLALFQQILGRIPKSFALSGRKSRDFFNKNGQLLSFKEINYSTISKILVEQYKFKEESADQIQDFLMPMLEYDPKKRITAREALKNKWLWN